MIIYLATNMVNGKRYVGQTIRPLKERWKDHCRVKDNNYFHRAIQKYGPENFSVKIIDTAETATELDEKEAFWIKELNTLFPHGYNLKEGGNVSMRGRCGVNNPKSRLIYQFRLDGSMVNGYHGIGEACRATGCSHSSILRSLKRGFPLTADCVWIYADSFSPERLVGLIDSYPGKRWKRVVCVETGEVFQSMTEAARAYNTTPGSISACCAGRLKTTARKHWKTL
ncbi:MAG: GIY-YIG nuclease family protein [Bacteroidaceae bacterium]|nr:GIY-YIG nuclease family protein [Bacteroidaceae bacterium]